MPGLEQFMYEGTLDQITPLLHFQMDEQMACLRATTVKPRLDAYVLHYLNIKGISEAEIPCEWKEALGPNEERRNTALRYKLFFWAKEPGIVETGKDIHKLFFGNMPQLETKRAYTFNNENPVQFRILSYVKGTLKVENEEYTLLQLLKKLLPPFFEFHSFGTRATKGFGSFKVHGSNTTITSDMLPPDCLAVIPVQSRSAPNILDAVYVLLGCMKGGFNTDAKGMLKHPEHSYIKGFIQKKERDAGWGTEKKFIKQRVFDSKAKFFYNGLVSKDHLAENDERPGKGYRFSRSMLGLTDTYKFGVGKNSLSYAVKTESGIERFPSPIRFKPTGKNNMLILVYRIPEPMRDAKFTIGGQSIHTPTDFNPVQFTEEFMQWVTQQHNNDSDFDINEHFKPNRMLVQSILQGLKMGKIIESVNPQGGD